MARGGGREGMERKEEEREGERGEGVGREGERRERGKKENEGGGRKKKEERGGRGRVEGTGVEGRGEGDEKVIHDDIEEGGQGTSLFDSSDGEERARCSAMFADLGGGGV